MTDTTARPHVPAPAIAPPPIRMKFIAVVFSATAFSNTSGGTRRGIIVCRAGWLKARAAPAIIAET